MIRIGKIKNPLLVSFFAFLLILLLGAIDYLVDYEISFSLFYLLPVSISALYENIKKPFIVFIALFSALMWGYVEISTNLEYSHFSIPVWNTFVRFVYFVSIGLLLYATKMKHLQLSVINKELNHLNSQLLMQKHEIELTNDQLNQEKMLSDRLILNILPKEIARELKEKSGIIANHFSKCSVMFTDFKDFTKVAEILEPYELVQELNFIFSAFDDIISKYGLEKIKTIGDSYMCAGGLPVENKKSALAITLSALEIRDFIFEYQQKRKEQNKPHFEIRIGIHTGELIAGVVGKSKFSYDIWGDTVNVASRLEKSCEPGMINISETTYLEIKDYFDCTFRGKIAIKNKEDLNMYFVDQLKEEYTDKENSSLPKANLLEEIR